MSDPTDLKLIIQPPPVLRATITPPADFKTTILVGQGPSGPPGGEEMKYSKRVDFVSTDTIYKGEAEPGSSEDDAVWRISKITFVDEDTTEQWAEGNASFDKMWSSRLGYNYY